jgi:hypothetical protein
MTSNSVFGSQVEEEGYYLFDSNDGDVCLVPGDACGVFASSGHWDSGSIEGLLIERPFGSPIRGWEWRGQWQGPKELHPAALSLNITHCLVGNVKTLEGCQWVDGLLHAWKGKFKTFNSQRMTVGRSGLVNKGNTCYQNSILQSLFVCDEFRWALMGLPLPGTMECTNLLAFITVLFTCHGVTFP